MHNEATHQHLAIYLTNSTTIARHNSANKIRSYLIAGQIEGEAAKALAVLPSMLVNHGIDGKHTVTFLQSQQCNTIRVDITIFEYILRICLRRCFAQTFLTLNVRGSKLKYRELLGRRIRQLRKKNGLSQEKFAELIGIDPNSVSRIECGVHYPSLDTIEKIALILKIEMRDLFLFSKKETAEEMRAFLIQTASDVGVENLQKMVRAVREIVQPIESKKPTH